MAEKTHFGFKEVDANKKANYVGEVFHSVAEEYDLMNDAMSFGMHRLWKQILIELAELNERSVVLDVASGTADIPKLISKKFKSASIHVTDINESMLALGKDRSINENFFQNCSFALASGEDLPYQNEAFDLVTVGFGLRNFTDKLKGLKEMKRVLKKDGILLILEFSKPTNSIFSKVYDWYSFNIIPKLGEFIANDYESYQYLVESIRKFPDQNTFSEMIINEEFKLVKYRDLTFGIAALHSGWKI